MRVVRNWRKLAGTRMPGFGGVSEIPEKRTLAAFAIAAETTGEL